MTLKADKLFLLQNESKIRYQGRAGRLKKIKKIKKPKKQVKLVKTVLKPEKIIVNARELPVEEFQIIQRPLAEYTNLPSPYGIATEMLKEQLKKM